MAQGYNISPLKNIHLAPRELRVFTEHKARISLKFFHTPRMEAACLQMPPNGHN